MAVWHPDVVDFITAKRTKWQTTSIQLSLLIDDAFMQAVINKTSWDLFFPVTERELANSNYPQSELVYKTTVLGRGLLQVYELHLRRRQDLCRIYKTMPAEELWDLIMLSTYDFAEPGFLLIDSINKYNNNYFCEEIRATNPCGEQPLPPNGSCLLALLI